MTSERYLSSWKRNSPANLAAFQVLFLLLVLLWGAVVRATGSGAGCGNHWPLCNGEVLPLAPGIKTMIEFTHRLSSGGSLLVCLWVLWFFRKSFSPGHPARRASQATFFFLIIEALLGAMLVLLDHVADNPSLYRAASTSLHLVNTFFLMASALLTFLWAKEDVMKVSAASFWEKIAGIFVAFSLMLLAATGAVTALGDTLFPLREHSEAIIDTLNSGQIFLVRLRIIHPIFAMLMTVLLLMFWAQMSQGGRLYPRLSLGFFVILASQILLGFLNIEFFAPIALQLLHLLLAHLLWLTLIAMLDVHSVFKMR